MLKQDREIDMHVRQFHLQQLGHASYLVGDAASRTAIVVDPQLDTRGYVDAARDAGLRITHVLDTHAHSDYVSGRDALARVTGATVLVSAHGEPPVGAQVAFGHGDELEFGATWVRALHMPGHAPEQLALLVGTDPEHARAQLVLSGGSLLCGDIGRPDIDESRPASVMAPEAVARIREQLLALEDDVRVYPTHVAGSLCSAAADGATETTIGRERRHNTWLRADADLDAELARLPRKPSFWTRLRHMNATDMPVHDVVSRLERLTPEAALGSDAILVDARDADAYAATHLAGSVHLGASASAPVLAGALLDADTRTIVVADDEADALRLAHDLQRAGVAAPSGWVSADPDAWRRDAVPTEVISTPQASELLRRDPAPRLLDVRQPAEWADHGVVDGALLLSLPDLPELGRDLPREPLAVACAAGRRSITAVSILRHLGRAGDESLAGGVDAWQHATEPALER